MDLLPQVRPEDLDQGDLEGWDLAVHEDTRQIQLHLEAHIHIRSVNRWGPPEREASIGDLIQTTSLSVGQLLESHGLFKATCLLPEETFPSGEVGSLEQGVLQDAFNTPQGLDHVGAVVVQVPELAIMALVCPPERILAVHLILLEVLAHTPALVKGQGVSVLLEQGVDAWNTAVPCILQVLQRETPVLCVGFLALQGVLSPHTLTVDELSLPCLNVAVQVGNELVFLMAQTTAVVGDACLCLLRVSQVRLRDQDVTHAEHAQTTKLLWRVEDNRWETRRHLGVQTNLDAGLHLVFALHEQIQQRIRVDNGFTEVGHHSDQVCVPLVGDLCEGRGT
mmetsp:Transcript_25456/g.58663  ORF Transcript_25456/g.58663 Transcript_25456/m.58663 type:complete len:336 (+) Transcript_25456:2317-3324(+)